MTELANKGSNLFVQVSHLIQDSHARVASTVNAEMAELYWQVGNAINQNVLGGERTASLLPSHQVRAETLLSF